MAAGIDKVRGVVWHIKQGLEWPVGFSKPQILCGEVIGHQDMGQNAVISSQFIPERGTDKDNGNIVVQMN